MSVKNQELKKFLFKTQEIYLDIGDLYTKVFIYSNGKKEYDICFPSIVKKKGIEEEFSSRYKEAGAESFIQVGWDAVYTMSCDDLLSLRLQADLYDIISKVLFDYGDDNVPVTIHLVGSGTGDDFSAENFTRFSEDSDFIVSGFINGVAACKTHRISCTSYPVSELLLHYISSLSKNDLHDFTVVIDIGFKKTKVILLDNKHHHTALHLILHGFDYYLKKLNDYFSDSDIDLHPFVLLKELERGNFDIDTPQGTLNITNIIDQSRFDLNTFLLDGVEGVLKTHYDRFLVWPEICCITGGGAGFNGPMMQASLAGKYEKFKRTMIEQRPRDYLLRAWQRQELGG